MFRTKQSRTSKSSFKLLLPLICLLLIFSTGCARTVTKLSCPAMPEHAKAMADELEGVCYPLRDGVRVNACPMFWDWMAEVEKLRAQLALCK